MYDLQGPKHCLYHDTDLFMQSWVSEDTDCPSFAEYQGKVNAYQGDCHKAPTHNYQPYITSEYMKSPEGCKLHLYFITEEQNRLCVMTSPTCKCGPSCKEIIKEHSMVNYKCWPKDSAPSEVKSNYPTPGYVEKPVPESAERI